MVPLNPRQLIPAKEWTQKKPHFYYDIMAEAVDILEIRKKANGIKPTKLNQSVMAKKGSFTILKKSLEYIYRKNWKIYATVHFIIVPLDGKLKGVINGQMSK